MISFRPETDLGAPLHYKFYFQPEAQFCGEQDTESAKPSPAGQSIAWWCGTPRGVSGRRQLLFLPYTYPPTPLFASVGPTHTSFPWQLGLTRLLDSEKHPIIS